jgi:hypothetical protein
MACFALAYGMGQGLRRESRSFYEILAEKEIEETVKLMEDFPGFFTEEELNDSKDVRDEKIRKKALKKYAYLDGRIQHVKDEPLSSIWGGINYGMSLEEMEQAVRDKFIALYAEGKIISEDDFEKIKNDYYTEKPHTELSRLWGAFYLKNAIDKSDDLRGKYDVPDYVIVAPDLDNIEVDLGLLNDMWPIVSSLKNATFYFKKITGRRVAQMGMDEREKGMLLSGTGYYDFSDPGNIIQDDKTGQYIVVDTEYKSFQISLPPLLRETLKYAGKKFAYLYHDMYRHTIPIGILEKKQH